MVKISKIAILYGTAHMLHDKTVGNQQTIKTTNNTNGTRAYRSKKRVYTTRVQHFTETPTNNSKTQWAHSTVIGKEAKT